MIINILAFIFVLGILVMVHELGHFTAARFFGVRVDKFAFGFPPKIWSKKGKETEYTINLIPFGGYVSMYGEEGGHTKDPRSFTSKSASKKAVILGAGVMMNLVLAYIILLFFYLIGGKALITGMDNYQGVTNNEHVYITEVVSGSPAEKAGIVPGDMIKSVGGTEVRYTANVFEGVQDATKDDSNNPVSITIVRDGAEQTKEITAYTETQDGKEIQRIGVTMEERGKTQAKWYVAPWVALLETGKIIWLTMTAIWGVLVSIFTKFSIGEGVGGPVAIYSLSGTFARIGFWALAQFIAILSISLALFNALPFPALDGGHIMILAIEGVRGKKIKDSTKNAINNTGFGLLLLLMVTLVVRDLARLDVFEKIKGIFK